jgi:hypothetical protein
MSLFGNAVKKVLNEALSQVAYHFTDLLHLHKIIDGNKIKFSDIERAYHDINLANRLSKNDKYGYFLSTTRQRNSTIGYPSYINSNVRITLDSDAFNSTFHSEPIDFFYGNCDNESSKQSISNGKASPKSIRHQQEVESEDRIFSNKKYLSDINRYIRRIDILFSNDLLRSKGYVEMLDDIIHSYMKDKIFVYDNERDFNFQTNNTINLEELL